MFVLEALDADSWVDTLVMPADPLTKAMRADLLIQVIGDNRWSFASTEEMKAGKIRKATLRRNAKSQIDNGDHEDGAPAPDATTVKTNLVDPTDGDAL